MVLDYIDSGIVFSSIIVLGSIELSLVYSIADVANFAHGDTMTVGAYTAFVTFGALGGLGGAVLGLPLGFFVALLVGIAAAAVVAVITEKVIYERMDVGSIELLITSIGIAFIYRAVIQMGFGADFTRFSVPSLRPIKWLLPYGIRVTLHDIAIVGCASILVVGLHVLLQYSDLGRKMRAMADNPDLARVSGIRTGRVKLWTWIIGAGLAGAGGVIGSVYGAMAGGFLTGMINQMTPLLSGIGALIPFVESIPYITAEFGIGIEYANAIAFVIMVAVLLIRPNGIAGEAA